MRLALCIVGCGGYARTVLNEIHDLPWLDLYFASRDESKARRYCETYGGAGSFGGYEEAVSDPRVQAAYFLTPHHLHLEHALLAARHGKHILMEKPIARTIPEAEKMVDAARGAGVELMVAENYRFLPTVTKCKELMEQGLIGDLRLIQVQVERYLPRPEWRASAELTGGGVMIDGGIHLVDLMVSLGGFPRDVYALAPTQVFRDADGEDGLVLTARLSGDAVGLLHYSMGTPIASERQRATVTGTLGALSFSPYGRSVVLETPAKRRRISLAGGGRGVRQMVGEFAEGLREGRRPLMSGTEALADLTVVLAAYRSVELGRPVAVERP